MTNNMFDLDFYQGKRVLVTGHTGFKGSWLCKVLIKANAILTGYSLKQPTIPSLFELCHMKQKMNSVIGDIRDLRLLMDLFNREKPEVVIHLAAQPIVRDSYKNPVYTYETNVMGTVNVLEAIRQCQSVRSFVNVTTDKVYLNKEWEWGYRENEELNGYDPYSNSKSCAELITDCYKNAFFENRDIAISTCRAGNVIGGGDFAKERIIPDCFRAIQERNKIIVRNVGSTRPWQHVLEPVFAYLMIAEAQYNDLGIAGNYNIGPNDDSCCTTGDLVDLFCAKWEKITGFKVKWENRPDDGPHEANCLKLDCSKIRKVFGWKPTWNLEKTIEKIVEWNRAYLLEGDIEDCMDQQINEFMNEIAQLKVS